MQSYLPKITIFLSHGFYISANMANSQLQQYKTVRLSAEVLDYVCRQGHANQSLDEVFRQVIGMRPMKKIRKTPRSSSKSGNTLFSEKETSGKT